jgi:hypothetical protein
MNKLMVVLTLVFAACGGGGSLSLEEFPQELRDAYCRNLVRCGVVEDLGTCQKESLGRFEIDLHLSATQFAVFDANKAKFDGGKAKDCVDKVANASCDLTDEVQRGLSLLSSLVLPETCGLAATGTLHAGEACTVGSECISQACQIQACNMACCPGTCLGDAAPAIAKAGESCQRARCATGTFCNPTNTTCTALKAAGASCTSQEECDYGSACIGDGPTGLCTKLPHTGETCTDFCTDFGSICDPTTKKCVKVVLAGDACLGQGFNSNCSVLYSCDAGRCNAGLAIGAQCAADDHCADFRAFCDVPEGALNGTCVLPKANGQSCIFDEDCDSSFCDFDMGLCVDEPVCI